MASILERDPGLWGKSLLMQMVNLLDMVIPYVDILAWIDGKYIRKGDSPYGAILFNSDGKNIREGQTNYGSIVATIWDQKIRA